MLLTFRWGRYPGWPALCGDVGRRDDPPAGRGEDKVTLGTNMLPRHRVRQRLTLSWVFVGLGLAV